MPSSVPAHLAPTSHQWPGGCGTCAPKLRLSGPQAMTLCRHRSRRSRQQAPPPGLQRSAGRRAREQLLLPPLQHRLPLQYRPPLQHRLRRSCCCPTTMRRLSGGPPAAAAAAAQGRVRASKRGNPDHGEGGRGYFPSFVLSILEALEPRRVGCRLLGASQPAGWLRGSAA